MTQLEKYYNKFKEDHRLTTRHGSVEFAVSMEKIRECASKCGGTAAKILDVGAGTGRYSVALSEEGFDVTAVELVKHNLDILLSKHAKVKCWPGDARDLSFLPDKAFDALRELSSCLFQWKQEDRLIEHYTEGADEP